jgi:hypothetical protein
LEEPTVQGVIHEETESPQRRDELP